MITYDLNKRKNSILNNFGFYTLLLVFGLVFFLVYLTVSLLNLPIFSRFLQFESYNIFFICVFFTLCILLNSVFARNGIINKESLFNIFINLSLFILNTIVFIFLNRFQISINLINYLAVSSIFSLLNLISPVF